MLILFSSLNHAVWCSVLGKANPTKEIDNLFHELDTELGIASTSRKKPKPKAIHCNAGYHSSFPIREKRHRIEGWLFVSKIKMHVMIVLTLLSSTGKLLGTNGKCLSNDSNLFIRIYMSAHR